MAYNKDRDQVFDEEGEGGKVIDLHSQVARHPHEQIHKSEPLVRTHFDSAQFVGFLDSMHYNKRGEAVITLIVPYRFRNFAVPMVDTYGVPLSVDVQLWKPYTERLNGMEQHGGS